jgi:hypothetical protein
MRENGQLDHFDGYEKKGVFCHLKMAAIHLHFGRFMGQRVRV